MIRRTKGSYTNENILQFKGVDNVVLGCTHYPIIKENIKNVTRVDFLPYHKLGSDKYVTLGIDNPYLEMPEMDKTKCNQLYEIFMEDFKR